MTPNTPDLPIRGIVLYVADDMTLCSLPRDLAHTPDAFWETGCDGVVRLCYRLTPAIAAESRRQLLAMDEAAFTNDTPSFQALCEAAARFSVIEVYADATFPEAWRETPAAPTARPPCPREEVLACPFALSRDQAKTSSNFIAKRGAR